MPIHGNTGFKCGVDAGGPFVTPDTRTFTPDPVREKNCIDFLKSILPTVSKITRDVIYRRQEQNCNFLKTF